MDFRMEWGIVSCIIRYYFNPCGTGSHLYSANTNTLRSRTLSSRSYTTLVGLGVSPQPCIPLLYLDYITSFATCQDLFEKFLLAVRLERTSSLCRLNRRHQPQMGEPDSNGWSGTLGGLSATDAHHLCFVPLLYHNLDDLSTPFSKKFRVSHR